MSRRLESCRLGIAHTSVRGRRTLGKDIELRLAISARPHAQQGKVAASGRELQISRSKRRRVRRPVRGTKPGV